MTRPFSEQNRLRRATWIYWLLLVYIISALVWWLITLQTQNEEKAAFELSGLQTIEKTLSPAEYQERYKGILKARERRSIKHISEGVTFLAITFLGALFVYRAVRKQLKLNQQQQNFIMAVTHELKTPIAVSKLNIETLRKRKLTEDQQHRLIQNTLDAMQRLTDLTNNILVVSQLDTGDYKMNREAINLSVLLEDTVSEFQKQFAGRTLRAVITPEIFVTGDELMLKLVMHNLIDNALKYSPAGEPVTVELEKAGRPVVKISDRGVGISKEDRDRVFEKFYRSGSENTRTAKGTGLGLYLCKKILADHRADIVVTDNNPTGSIFVVTFTHS